MGLEYTLRIKSFAPGAVRTELERLDGASVPASPAGAIEYRQQASRGDSFPDATVIVESTTVYFCDHGGFGQAFLGRVVARLVQAFGAVEIEELE